MISEAFNRTLTATGYITADGRAAPGLVQIASAAAARLRPVLADDRIGLNAKRFSLPKILQP